MSSIDLGIIDEGLMLNKLCYETLDMTLKDLVPEEDKQKRFGDKIILVSGDFCQLLPVMENASSAKLSTALSKIPLFYEMKML